MLNVDSLEAMVQVVSVSGFGSTGSSAVVDFLSEVDGVFVFPGEFRLIQDPDGLLDLCSSISNYWGWLLADAYLKRFVKYTDTIVGSGGPFRWGERFENHFNVDFVEERNRFVQRVSDVSTSGYWHYDAYHSYTMAEVFQEKVKHRWLRILGKDAQTFRNLTRKKTLRFVRPGSDVFSESRTFLERLLFPLAEASNAHTIVLDQGILPYHFDLAKRLLPDLKAIVVDRDPGDVFLDARNYNAYPITNDPMDFVTFYRSVRDFAESQVDAQVLRVRFEQLVCNYDATAKLILDFVGADISQHRGRGSRFNPAVSRKNMGLWASLSGSDREDVDFIRKMLAKWNWPEESRREFPGRQFGVSG